jgi:hypothetical protein
MRRQCADCATAWRLYEEHRGEIGLTQFLDLLLDAGLARDTIEAALLYDPDGGGALRDRLTADMANRMLADMGVAGRQTAADVKRLREQGGGGASTTRPAGDAKPPSSRR